METEIQTSWSKTKAHDFNKLRWGYECQTCARLFSIKVPSGPREERAIRCSKCGSRDVQRINVCKLSEAAAGE